MSASSSDRTSELRLEGVPVLDDYSETFTAVMAAVIVTGPTPHIASEAAYETKGLGRSATQPPCECAIVRKLPPEETPDGRPGYLLVAFDRKAKHLRECLALRLRKGTLPYPQTAAFDGLGTLAAKYDEAEMIDLHGTVVQRFADGFDKEETRDGRTLMILPRMDGPMSVERTYRTLRAVTGGMFLIYGTSDEVLDAAMRATAAAAAVEGFDGLVTAKCAASGSKVGGINDTDMVATTNHRCCPSLRDQVDDSLVPDDVTRIYEIIVSGPTEEAVRAGMAAGMRVAAADESVVGIGTANYGGKLGSGQIPLRDLVG